MGQVRQRREGPGGKDERGGRKEEGRKKNGRMERRGGRGGGDGGNRRAKEAEGHYVFPMPQEGAPVNKLP